RSEPKQCFYLLLVLKQIVTRVPVSAQALLLGLRLLSRKARVGRILISGCLCVVSLAVARMMSSNKNMMSSSKTIEVPLTFPTKDPTIEQPAPEYTRWRNALKRMLLSGGARMPSALVECLTRSLAIVEISNWVASHCSPSRTVSLEKVERLYDLIGERVGRKQTLYLEFGVWKGYSIRYWSRLLKHPQSMLHGFDSFEGLPESWTAFYRKGSFAEAGQIPEVSDSRVKFFKGWFEETLPNYVVP